MSNWMVQFNQLLAKAFGKKQSEILYKKYQPVITHVYQDETSSEEAIIDIKHIEKLSDTYPIEIALYIKDKSHLHLRLFAYNKPLALSNIIPILENFGLTTYSGNSYTFKITANETCWIDDFFISYINGPIDIEKAQSLFQDTFAGILTNDLENDKLNQLVFACYFNPREIELFRAYAKYLKQTGYRFSQAYIEKALLSHPQITLNLLFLFKNIHDPHLKNRKHKNIEASILKALEVVSSLDEDNIIRRLIELIKNTLRTNFFQTPEKQTIVLKLNSRHISQLPQPVPLYETFVYSARFEAIHLRNSKVARGGIRWSDRNEDFRTEILGLMKAQTVKNAVIVPSGAKGGFVLKKQFSADQRSALLQEGISCYQSFIRGLLEITDNIKNGKIISPKNVVCHDDADTYLVVAADKGTSTFSDIANKISIEMDYWLTDAFASGGSTGYDHKKMGITARGAWESIKRHFLEINIDIAGPPITVVGIGDMSGDVFGNGMIYSNNIKLVAAFDHRHLFLDPTPDPKKSFCERLRLFKLPTSSWENYNTKLISAGGGVYPRSLKSIPISPEVKNILNIEANSLTPNELIQAILKAPVDLLFNGGIGTYVKASNETSIDVGDRTNDYTRVNGNELQVKVVGEGGNLGFTQLGRVEYALKGGLINTDSIDNSAGVDCSDHEVNLKILLNIVIQHKKLSIEKRNILLASLTEEVAALVLKDNYEQALALSYAAHQAKHHISLDTQYIKDLDAQGILKRKIEYLPDDKQLAERKSDNYGLMRPELAILLAYAKISLKSEILKTNITGDAFFARVLKLGFPQEIGKKYEKILDQHPLKADIIATQISNQIVNEMGVSFIYRLQLETDATIEEIIRSITISSNIFEINKLQSIIHTLEFKIPLQDQYEIIYYLRKLIHLSTRWFLRSSFLSTNIQETIEFFSTRIKKLEVIVPFLITGDTKNYLDNLTDKFLQLGLPVKTAKQIATYRAIYTTLNVIEVASKNDIELLKAAKVYFKCGEMLHLVWFRDQIMNDTREGYTNALARLALRDGFDVLQRKITLSIIANNPKENNTQVLIQQWMKKNSRTMDRWNKLITLIHSSNTTDYTLFFVAIREMLSMNKLK